MALRELHHDKRDRLQGGRSDNAGNFTVKRITGVRYVRDEAETQVVGAEETAFMRLGLKPAAIVPKSSERLQA